MKFRDFGDLSLFPRILSLKSFGNLWGNSHVPCLSLIIILRVTCGEKKIWYQEVSKYYVHDCSFCLYDDAMISFQLFEDSYGSVLDSSVSRLLLPMNEKGGLFYLDEPRMFYLTGSSTHIIVLFCQTCDK